MTSHDTALALAAAALDFELTGAERAALADHLATCAACRAAAAGLRADAAALGSIPAARLAPERGEAILAGVLAPRSVRPPLRLLLVAALLALLALGSVLVGAELLQRRDDLAVVPPVPSPSPSGEGTAAVPAWTRATVPATTGASRYGIVVEDVAIGPSGFVAVGRPECATGGAADPSDCRMAVLTSETGVEWSHLPAQESLATAPSFPLSGPELGIRSVTWGPAGWVAVGYVADPRLRVAIWTSSDGRTWVRSPVDATFANAEPKSIAAGPDGYVIVGSDYGNGTADLESLRSGKVWAVAWTSHDGRTWTRTAHDATLAVGGLCDTMEWPSYGGMRDVTALGGGGFIAVGTTMTTGTSWTSTCIARTAAWTSRDGSTWERIPAFPALEAWDVAIAAGDGEVAAIVKCPDPGCSTVATSGDGASWSTAPGPDPAGPTDVAIVDGEVWAAGPNGAQRDGSPLWRLEATGAWSQVALPGWTPDRSLERASLAVADGRVVLLGWGTPSSETVPSSFCFVRH